MHRLFEIHMGDVQAQIGSKITTEKINFSAPRIIQV